MFEFHTTGAILTSYLIVPKLFAYMKNGIEITNLKKFSKNVILYLRSYLWEMCFISLKLPVGWGGLEPRMSNIYIFYNSLKANFCVACRIY